MKKESNSCTSKLKLNHLVKQLSKKSALYYKPSEGNQSLYESSKLNFQQQIALKLSHFFHFRNPGFTSKCIINTIVIILSNKISSKVLINDKRQLHSPTLLFSLLLGTFMIRMSALLQTAPHSCFRINHRVSQE